MACTQPCSENSRSQHEGRVTALERVVIISATGNNRHGGEYPQHFPSGDRQCDFFNSLFPARSSLSPTSIRQICVFAA